MLSRCQLASSVSKAASASLDIRLASNTINRRSNIASSSFHTTSTRRRPFGTDKPPGSTNPSPSANELFSGNSWDSMLEELGGQAPVKVNGRSKLPVSPKPRQSMTERESKVLTDMLDMIFAPKDKQSAPSATEPTTLAGTEDEVGPTQVNDLFGRLRRLGARRPTQKARSATAELLDMKKEQMNSCSSDRELLEWAAREVFEESVRYEQAAKRAAAEAAQSPDKAQKKTQLPLQSPIYPQMIAHLMRTFREHYHDPNLALYIFAYAQKLSIVSYTFGCSTDAYNELIGTRWSSFKDMKGVLDALKEMDVNAVPSNNRTQQIVEQIRRDVGEHGYVAANSSSKLLLEVEEALACVAGGKKTQFTGLGAWKKIVETDGDEGFDDWSNLDKLINPADDKKPLGKRRGVK